MFADDCFLIQVKQSDKDAEQERAAFHKRTGRIIKLLTVQEILDEAHVQKMWGRANGLNL